MTVKVLMGESYGAKSPVVKSTPLSYLHVKIPPTGKFTHPTPLDHNAFVYIYKGSAKAAGKELPQHFYAIFEHDGDSIEIENASPKEPLEFLLLEGKPFNEPFFHRGPFVATSQAEWVKGMLEYQNGNFGEMDEAYVGELTD